MDGPRKKIHLATKLDNISMDDIKTIGEKFGRANSGPITDKKDVSNSPQEVE